ncbi:hypothetical protein EJ04DRAFT_9095 [Polyplosphaeria fusca]|uniref:Uncharacterized protein n=1 Tax=Polyplosphaeria fusca TaxID=682080 RepID=A0A9P4R917_9PLEO|nr:hypothetical protein EJ04DRAFT_9095 [Polyplosphaeria fusca]
MAEQITHDVVKQAQSMGGPSPIDAPATTTNPSAGDGDAPSESVNQNPKTSEAPSIISTHATSTGTSEVDGDALTSMTNNDDQTHVDGGPNYHKEELVNGDAGETSASEDVLSQQALGDASGGSDTDISRPGSVDPAKERPAGHLRSNSLKKPASFKSVSVTKNFLAKSAASTPPSRPGEKAAPAGLASVPAQLSARPRLVAKSGTGIGNLQRGSLSKINGAGSGPDASKVWNKNQPVPLPPPKQFTDEELKQQFGIHMATRLKADESGKEAKWADIDDDEDDWAPDTVQWMDGTKSTVAAVEDQPPPAGETPPATESPVEEEKPAPAPPSTSQPSTSTSGTKTILKPGAHAQNASTKPALGLKGQSDKPTLVAKPSATAPVKSPWATLPPVDKMPLVQPPMQPPPPRFSQRDHGYESYPASLQPAKEIAPDDFNRSWRDERGNRELFNSHSGRYEPVHETRRGSVRDGSFRQQPSVLQRPSQDGPAEPSAAFQTSRTSADTPSWGRRRNSSNVSGGSGRRMSIDRRGPDVPLMPLNVQRRGSHSMNGPDTAVPGTPRFAQKALNTEAIQPVPEQPASWAQRPSPSLTHAQPVSPYGSVASSGIHDGAVQAAPVPVENAVEVQNRLMREKLERARLAKQQEREREEREEAERKERLRKKLEAMGLTDDSKSKSKEQSPARSIEKSPLKETAAPAPVQSPPKPPVPTSEGEVAQYGMMKVHQPQPVKKQYHSEANTQKSFGRGESAPKPSPSPVKAQTEAASKLATSLTATPPPANNIKRDDRTNKSQPEQSHAAGPVQPPDTQGLSAWSNTSLAQQPRTWSANAGANVWGPPQSKDRALGNGTFDSGYNRAQSRPGQHLPAQAPSVQPAAIGSDTALKASPPQPQVASARPFAQPPMYTQTQTLPSQAASAAPAHGSKMHPPGPIGPPAEKTWGNFAAAIRHDDQETAAKAQNDYDRFGGHTFRPEFRETYTDQQGKTQKTVHQKVGGTAALLNGNLAAEVSRSTAAPEVKPKDEATKPAFTSAAVPSEGPSQSHLQPSGPTARSSRFFPRAQPTANTFDSPPPPETEAHPAFTGDSHHPVVKMPKPSPRVRLPPAAIEAAVAPEAPVSMPTRFRPSHLGARPLALDPEWQARFNSLLEKSSPATASVPGVKGPSPIQPPSHAKASSLAVAPSSKAPLDVREAKVSATVSLPNAPPNGPPKKPFVEDNSSDVVTRTCVEAILLEEREFGSLPIVRLSKVPHLAAHEPAAPSPISRSNSRFPRHVDTTTKSTLSMSDNDSENIDVVIRLPNMKEPITKSIPRKRGRKGPGPKPRRNFTPTNGPSGSTQNPRSRKPSNYQSQGSNSNSNSNSNNATRQSNGGSGWSNNRSTTTQTNSWARRATAPIVH